MDAGLEALAGRLLAGLPNGAWDAPYLNLMFRTLFGSDEMWVMKQILTHIA
jgi:hypothetical protein